MTTAWPVSARGRATRSARRHLGAFAVAMLVLLPALVPTTAQAAGEVVGGTTRGTAVPLPMPDLDSQVVVGNLNATAGGGRWNLMSWYSWTATTTQPVFMRATSLDPGGWDNALEVWQGGSMIAQNDDFYGYDAGLRVNFVAGTTYTIGLGAYSSGRGTARLTFSTRVPTVPLDVQAAPRDRGTLVTWSAPQDLAGGVTRYDVRCAVGSAEPTACGQVQGTPPSRSVTVTGLTNGEPVTVTVTASNVIGASEPSAPVTVVPQASSTTAVSLEPGAPVSGEPFTARAVVTVPSGSTAPTGTVDLVVGGTTYAALPVTDGTVAVEGLTAPAGPLPVSAVYSGSAAVVGSTGAASYTVARRGQSVTLEPLPDGLVYAGAPVTLVASATSGGPVDLAASGACAVEGDQLSFTDVGTCTVTASQAGDSETLPAEATVTAEIGQRPQVVTVAEVPTLVYAQEPVDLAATSDTGLPVTVTAEGACALDEAGALVTTGVGTCTVTATQEGDTWTLPAEPVVRTVDVVRRADVVTFDLLDAPTLGAPTPVAASSLVGLPVTLVAEGACVLADDVLWAVATGDCVVTAATAGDELTEPATATDVVAVADVPADVRAVLAAQLGAPAAGAEVFARAAGLRPGTEFTLTVFSVPRVLGTAVVAADGTALVGGTLPADLELGAHRLVATGTALNGSPVASEVAFRVGPGGILVQIGNQVLTPATAPAAVPGATLPRARAALAATGAGAHGVLVHAVLSVLLGCGAVVAARRRPTA